MKVVDSVNKNFYPNKKIDKKYQSTSTQRVAKTSTKSFEERFGEIISRMQSEPFDLTTNVYNMGRLLEEQEGKLNDKKLDFIIGKAHELLETPQTKEYAKVRHVNAINILYSSILKVIPQSDVLSKQVSPEAYRRVVDESLLMYKKYPLKGSLDIRHIIGRYVSLKDMSAFITRKYGYVPKEYNAVKWTASEQLDFTGALEEAYKNYDKSNAAFTVKSAASCFDPNRENSYNELKNNYERNLLKTMDMLKQELASMLKYPRKNFFDIKSVIEIIHTFFDKIPADTDLIFPAYSILRITNIFEDRFYKLLKKKG